MNDPVAADTRVSESIAIPARELRWRFSRSSGPGGQSVNTSDSRVEVSWNVSESAAISEPVRRRIVRRLANRLVGGCIVITASEHRGQLANRRAALERLARTVRTAAAPPRRQRRATKPSKGAVERRLRSKRRRSQIKGARGPVTAAE